MHQLSFSAFAAAQQKPGVVLSVPVRSLTGRKVSREPFVSLDRWLDEVVDCGSYSLDAPEVVPSGGVYTLESSDRPGEFFSYFEVSRPGAWS